MISDNLSEDKDLKYLALSIKVSEKQLCSMRKRFLLKADWYITDEEYYLWGKEGHAQTYTDEEAFENELLWRGWKLWI